MFFCATTGSPGSSWLLDLLLEAKAHLQAKHNIESRLASFQGPAESTKEFLACLASGKLGIQVALSSLEELQGANCTFAANGPSGAPLFSVRSDWESSLGVAGVVRILLDEIGQWIDDQLIGAGATVSDDREAFAGTVAATELSTSALGQINTEEIHHQPIGQFQLISTDQPAEQISALAAALEQASQLLAERARQPEFADLLRQVFGGAGTPPEEFEQRLANLQQTLATGAGLGLDVEIRSGEELAGLIAAYAATGHTGTERIYFNSDWALKSGSPDLLELVALEELGHALEQRLNGSTDSKGDEGKAFAFAVTGRRLSLDGSDSNYTNTSDHYELLLNGVAIAVEAATPPSSWTIQATQTDYFFTSYTGTNPAQGQATFDLSGGILNEQSYANDIYENLLFSNTSNGGPRNFDIKQVDLGYNDDFIIFRMTVNGIINKGGGYYYELEVDGSSEARPDFWLQYLHNEESSLTQSAWTNDQGRFSLYKDANNDVGGSNITAPSGTPGDGYESEVKLSSQDSWYRVNGGQLEIAISRSKLELTSASSSAGVRAWSSQSSTLDKSKFLWHDQNETSDLDGASFDNTNTADTSTWTRVGPGAGGSPPIVNSITVNEASPFAVFQVKGIGSGQTINLQLDASGVGTGFATLTGAGADLSGNLIQYSEDGGATWLNATGVGTDSSGARFTANQTFDASGSGALLVRVRITNDSPPVFEGPETFLLKVTNPGGTTAGVGTIRDDGSGNIFDGSGNIDPSGSKDDDRGLSITGDVYNEASPFIFWTISGSAGQSVKFVSLAGDSSGADVNADLSGNLQYRDASGVWRNFDGSNNAILDGSGSTLVRKAIVNDSVFEGKEDFKLIVENLSGTDASGTGISSIRDDASGALVDGSGNTAPGTLDDDRGLSITGDVYNEASPFIFWTISGSAGQSVKFVSLAGDSSGADVNADLSGNLQYRDASGVWRNFDGSNNAILDGSGSTLVRKAIVNDSVFEGKEDFKLIVEDLSGTDASGTGISSIRDDASGALVDGSGNTAPGTLDDDRGLSITGDVYNEASPFIFWTISGSAGQSVKFVSLAGDSSGADVNADLSGNLQYRDASGVWRNFDGSNNAILDGSGSTLVRKAIVNDSVFEGKEDFKLIVENLSGTDASGTGISSIRDDASGALVDGSGNTAPGTLDDDRGLSITGDVYNEASPFIFWTISGSAGQSVKFVSLAGDSSGADVNADLSGNLQYRDASGVWRNFDGSNNAILDGSGSTLVRKAIVNDSVFEGKEDFKLIVENLSGTDASGTGISSIRDDASGALVDGSGNTAPGTLDDDRGLSITGDVYNEASPFIFWTISGSAGQSVKFVSLAGDSSGADVNADLSGNLQYRDASGVWRNFDGSNNAILDGSGSTLVRKAIVNDSVFEGKEDFKLIVEDLSGTDASGTGISSIRDDASGALVDGSGNTAPGTLDDDRGLSITGDVYNEASPFIFWTISGSAGQSVKFVSLAGDSSGADVNADLSGNLQYRDASGVWRNFDGSNNAILDGSGSTLVRKAIVNDSVFEGKEDFKLIVENLSGTDASGTGISSIRDDASGALVDGSGNTAPGTLDDDRGLSITGDVYNEASPFIFWTISGSAGQSVKFVSLAGDSSGADVNADLSGNLQYRDASGVWRNFDGSNNAILDGSGSTLVRKAIVNDSVFEGKEDFKLIVENLSGTDASGTGISSIRDDASGALVDGSGNTAPGTLDDDRGLSITGDVYNEASPFIFWTISGSAGQSVKFVSLAGDSSGADVNADLSGNLQYRDASGVWRNFDGSNNAILDGSGSTLVRKAIVNDSVFEGKEDFKLIVENLSGTDASGTGISSIRDDASGALVDGSGNTALGTLDDDRGLSITGDVYNEASPFIFWTISGSAGQSVKFVSLAGDSSGADVNADLSGNLQYRDASGVWRNFDGSNNAILDGSGSTLVRKAIVNDSVFEGKEDFKLIVENLSGTDASGTGISSIRDDASGALVDGSGNTAPGTLDDDRGLSITGNVYNEASPFIFWTISGSAGQSVKFVSLSGDSSGADVNADLSGNLQYRDASGVWRNFDGSNNAILDGSGSTLVRKAIVNDSVFEGKEDFKLIVENLSGTDASGTGISSIRDDASGALVDGSGNTAPGTLDDDRGLSITGDVYNEASPFIFWTISGSAGQSVKFVSLAGDSSGADVNADLSGNLQYRDASGVWRNFDGSNNAILDGSGSTLVRKAIVNDSVFEGKEDFKLIVENLSGTDASGTGISSIRDDASGALVDGSGNTAPGTLDDDRGLSITGDVYNEASPFIFWTISGSAGQSVKFVSLAGDSSGADVNADLSGNLQYRDASGVWRNFDGSNNAILDGSGSTLVRKAIVNDSVFEGKEDFKLIVENLSGTDASGTGISSIRDDASGALVDGSGNTAPGTLDDDRGLSITGDTYNEGSSFIQWTVKGIAGALIYVSTPIEGLGQDPFVDPSGGDISGILEYKDASGNWVSLEAQPVLLDASGSLLIRSTIINDNPFEGSEEFILKASYSPLPPSTSQLAPQAVSTASTRTGSSFVIDDGTGILLDPSGNPDPSGVLDNDIRVAPKLVLDPTVNSSTIKDKTTAFGLPVVQIIAQKGSANAFGLKGPSGELIDPSGCYTVTEVVIDETKSAYIITLIDADPQKPGVQRFGDFYQGVATNNPSNLGDGTYTIHFNEGSIGSFIIDTNQLSSKVLAQCLAAISKGSKDLESVLFGYRVVQPKPTNGDDVLLGRNQTDALAGLNGSDLLNGLGNRFLDISGNPVQNPLGEVNNAKQIDRLTGGKGPDWFQLGDFAGSYYASHGNEDHAVVTDFSTDDFLILHGKATDYNIVATSKSARSIYFVGTLSDPADDDLIAVIQGKAATRLSNTSLGSSSQITFL